MKQTALLKEASTVFGGGLLKRSHAKSKRPMSTKRPIHLVFKSRMATGPRSMLSPRHEDKIRDIVRKHSVRFGVRVYHYANGGNHLHLVVRIHNRELFQNFLRVISGLIARAVLRAERSSGKLTSGESFWQARPFTRIASWGHDYARLAKYMLLNNLEAIGFIARQPRGRGASRTRLEIITLPMDPSHEGARSRVSRPPKLSNSWS